MPTWKKVVVSGSAASLNSLNVATNVVAQSFTGSLFGTSSWSNNVVSSSYALTASYALNAGTSGTTYSEQFTNKTLLNVTHSLKTMSPLVQVYDLSYNMFIPKRITVINSSSIEVEFSSLSSGYVSLVKGGHFVESTIQLGTNITASTTLDSSAAGRYIPVSSSSAVNITINPNVFAVNDQIILEQTGTGQVTAITGSGMTLNGGPKTIQQHNIILLFFKSPTLATVIGGTT